VADRLSFLEVRRASVQVAMPRDPHEASRAGRIGALTMHGRYDARQTTEAGRAAFLARFERDVDPGGVLGDEERARRAESLRRAYFTRLAVRSAQVRQTRQLAKATSGEPDRRRSADGSDALRHRRPAEGF